MFLRTDNKLNKLQIVKFTTPSNKCYVWVAIKSEFDENSWEIWFGPDNEINEKNPNIDMSRTNGGHFLNIISNVVKITNSFIEFDQNKEVMKITCNSHGARITRIYKNKIFPNIIEFAHQKTYENQNIFLSILTRI